MTAVLVVPRDLFFLDPQNPLVHGNAFIKDTQEEKFILITRITTLNVMIYESLPLNT